MAFEKYTLILKHEMVDGNGNCRDIEQPYVLSMCFDRYMFDGYPGAPVMLNEMLDRFKAEILTNQGRFFATKTWPLMREGLTGNSKSGGVDVDETNPDNGV